MNVLALRLHPNQDVRKSVKQFAVTHAIQAGFILGGIGSLHRAAIRFANQPQPDYLEGPFEVLALSGTVSIHGIHIHMAIADSDGKVLGGHLCDGSIIHTTAEIIVGQTEQWVFHREMDEQTGFLELTIRPS